jgi:hypothetical protein
MSPTQVLTEGEQLIVKTEKKKCCHGNQKLQHFKRKCRARGLSEQEITTLIHKSNHLIISEQLLNAETTIHEQIKESNKRKRDECNSAAAAAAELFDSSIKSLSQLSISQEERATAAGAGLKKTKNSTRETILSSSSSSLFSNNDSDNRNRLNHSMYTHQGGSN